MDTAVWIAWERHRRSLEMARALAVPLHIVESRLPRLARYPLLCGRTLRLLLRSRPKVLIVQNPSIVLAALVLALRPALGYRLVVDAHNAAVQDGEGAAAALGPLYRLVQRRADRTIVTNPALAEIVAVNGGRPIVLPDPLPESASACRRVAGEAPVVTYICTFAADEPWLEVLAAAQRLPREVTMYVTGRPPRRGPAVAVMNNPRIRLTGYLNDAEYFHLLGASTVIVDLTRRPDCLVCGGYEAVAAGVPVVLSDTAALRAYFTKGAVFTANRRESIATALQEALRQHSKLTKEILALRSELARSWSHQCEPLATFVRQL